MELVLRNTHIYDADIEDKLKELIQENINNFDLQKHYKIEVSFDKINNYSNFEEFRKIAPERNFKVKPKKQSEDDKTKDILYDVLGMQMHKIEDCLNRHGIISRNSSISGDEFRERKEDIIIDIIESDSTNKIRCTSIAPDKQYILNTLGDMINKRLNELFDNLHENLHNEEFLCEVFDIPTTKDINKIFKAFATQYYELGFPFNTKNENEELIEKLKNKILSVAEKRIKR